MSTPIEEAFRGAAASIGNLVRTIVREELRHHLGPEADHLLNVKSAPMSARKLRALVRSGELRGYKHGKDTFVSASDFRAFIEGRPVQRTLGVAEPHPDLEHNGQDDIMVTLNLVPTDPEERRTFEARIARRRAEGGERAATLHLAEQERVRLDEDLSGVRSEGRDGRRRSAFATLAVDPRQPPVGPVLYFRDDPRRTRGTWAASAACRCDAGKGPLSSNR